MGDIFYRVVEDDLSDEDGQGWMVDVVIQTTDPADFKDFGDAIEECIDRIQERIDSEEDKDEPDEGYLEKLHEKLDDSNVTDWEEYTCSFPQPLVTVEGEEANVAEVAGRARCEAYIAAGGVLPDVFRERLESTRKQSASRKGKPRRKLKLLKHRPQPPVTFDKVKVDPRVLEVLTPAEIKGLLTRHKAVCEAQDWKPTYSSTQSDMGSHKHDGCSFRSLTVFLNQGECITFVALVPQGEEPPEPDRIMRLTTADFAWDATDDCGRPSDWRPESN